MKKKYTRSVILVASAIVLILAAVGVFSGTRYRLSYDSLTYPIPFLPISASSDHNTSEQEKTADKTNALVAIVIFKNTCPDCKYVEKDAVRTIRSYRHTSNGLTYIMANAKYPTVVNYGLANNAHNTPTILIKYHGVTIYQYTGRNIRNVKRLLAGRNPSTNVAFAHAVPSETIIQNDFVGSVNTMQPAVHVNKP